MRSLLLLAVPILAGACASFGQRPQFQALAGLSVNGARAAGSPTRYAARLLPRIGAGIRIPLTQRVALLSGLDLQQKGFRAESFIDDGEPGDYTIVRGAYRYTQLHLPLQISVSLRSGKTWGLECNGGMSYGFMLNATGEQNWEFYRSGVHIHSDRVPVRPRIALLPGANRLPASNPWNYGALALFNPAAALSVTLRLRRHLLLLAYGEYNLYDASSISIYSTRLYSLGFGVGYRL